MGDIRTIQCVDCGGPTPSIANKTADPKCRPCFKNQWTPEQRQNFFHVKHPGCDLCGSRPINCNGLCYRCFEGTYGPRGGGFAVWK